MILYNNLIYLILSLLGWFVLMAYGVPWLVLLIIFIFMVMIFIDYTDPVNKEQRIKDDKETLKKIKKELKADNRNKK